MASRMHAETTMWHHHGPAYAAISSTQLHKGFTSLGRAIGIRVAKLLYGLYSQRRDARALMELSETHILDLSCFGQAIMKLLPEILNGPVILGSR